MDAESTINTSMLENKFRDYIKQYRALLRWGVDKVFQDSRIDKLFNDVRRLIDARETEKASLLLSDLKKQINFLENQYPDQKGEIEKELFVRIQQLESIIEKTTGIRTDQMHLYLQTLEIARVAMQNDDWAEAKVKIEAVEMKVLTPQVIEKTRPNKIDAEKITAQSKSKSNHTIQKKKLPSIKTAQKAENNETKPVVNNTIKDSKKNHKAIDKVEQQAHSIKNNEITEQPSLTPVAQSLISTAKKLSIGRLITLQDLQKTLNTIDKSPTKNVRIGFFANFEKINSELACFSKKPLILNDTGSQIALLRLSISRELTIYLVGIPINKNLNFQQIINISPQFSSLFINPSDIETDGLKKLSDAIPELITKNKHLYIKGNGILNIEKNEFNKSAFTIIENTNSGFIEDAALHIEDYSGN